MKKEWKLRDVEYITDQLLAGIEIKLEKIRRIRKKIRKAKKLQKEVDDYGKK